jgi:hypothetical protein
MGFYKAMLIFFVANQLACLPKGKNQVPPQAPAKQPQVSEQKNEPTRLTSAPPSTVEVGPDEVMGNIDEVKVEKGLVHISGYACVKGVNQSIGVFLYLDKSESDGGTFTAGKRATQPSEESINKKCGTKKDTPHNFRFEIQNNPANSGKLMFIHGISPIAGKSNLPINGSGLLTMP